MSAFNQSGQTVVNQTNIGYSREQVENMLRYALEQTHKLVPDKRRIQSETERIIRDAFKHD